MGDELHLAGHVCPSCDVPSVSGFFLDWLSGLPLFCLLVVPGISSKLGIYDCHATSDLFFRRDKRPPLLSFRKISHFIEMTTQIT